ncbi:hypothetical protein [Methylomagnum sp.]
MEVPAPGWGRLEWVLARPRYRLKRFDLTHIPRANRAAALDLLLRQWSPFQQSAYYTSWNNGSVTVFGWNADLVEQATSEQGLKPARVRVIPETVLRPHYAEGARILACLQGVEGQIWSDGELLHSRWWREQPSQEAWRLFQRDAGLPPEGQSFAVPEPQRLDFLDKPWAKQAGSFGSIGENWRDERLVYFILVLLLAPPTCWYAAQLYQYREAEERLQAEYSRLQREAGPLATARGQALQALVSVQRLWTLDPRPHPLELMAWVAEKLLRNGDQLIEWHYRDGKLKFTLATAADIQSSEMVHMLQSSGFFDNVRSTPGKNSKSIILEMDVLPLKSAAPVDRV